ncbi:hypothetical protein G3I40_19610 [Streptomyces sp. SID14478]|uniref:hypothetical protein n=1 Tax=Streptomyces sp. SID14478 TaxID=2706073 RepID=UPI0013DD4C45|nr:hypothetical protein [Streptomyces sp. SID14478]NEB77407.1 hypothetical protein [Streptomyces sp. SID14478]
MNSTHRTDDAPHDVDEIVLTVEKTPSCPQCSRPTILLARYPHSGLPLTVQDTLSR